MGGSGGGGESGSVVQSHFLVKPNKTVMLYLALIIEQHIWICRQIE